MSAFSTQGGHNNRSTMRKITKNIR